ncbi:MAG: M48 family metallopeptidase [Candidatus Aenigmatarchaeota archaeon]
MRHVRIYIFLAALLATLLSCQTVPVTERQSLVLVGEQEELQLGLQAYRKILSESKLSSDPVLVEKVRTVGRRIASASHRPDLPWEFNVIENDDVVNAFCLPGGKVGVYTGIFKYAATDDELATVMSHEIAHAIARHGAERMTQMLIVQLGGIALNVAMREKGRETLQLANIAYGVGAGVVFLLPYSRLHEEEADHIGLIYMARAGYNPEAAISFWKKMAKEKEQKKGIRPPEFLSTHPSDERRVKNLEKLLPEAMKIYRMHMQGSTDKGLSYGSIQP